MDSTISTKTPESTLKPSKPRHAFANRVDAPRKVRFSQSENRKTTTKSIVRAALDSGASANCFPTSYKGTNHKCAHPNQATLAQAADDQIMASQATDELAIDALPQVSKHVDKCREISTPSLSVNKLCKGDLAVLFHGPRATVFKPATPEVPINGPTIMEGHLDQDAELHVVDVPAAATDPCKFREGAKSSIKHGIKHAKTITFRSVSALINCHHLCFGAPPIESWLSAIKKGWLTSFQGLTAARVNLHCNDKLQTSEGHLKPQRQHVQSSSFRHRTKSTPSQPMKSKISKTCWEWMVQDATPSQQPVGCNAC